MAPALAHSLVVLSLEKYTARGLMGRAREEKPPLPAYRTCNRNVRDDWGRTRFLLLAKTESSSCGEKQYSLTCNWMRPGYSAYTSQASTMASVGNWREGSKYVPDSSFLASDWLVIGSPVRPITNRGTSKRKEWISGACSLTLALL